MEVVVSKRTTLHSKKLGRLTEIFEGKIKNNRVLRVYKEMKVC